MHPILEGEASFSRATSYQSTPLSQFTQPPHGYGPRAPFQGEIHYSRKFSCGADFHIFCMNALYAKIKIECLKILQR